MGRTFRLSRRAEESMVDIGDWTTVTFGLRQSDTYLETLVADCHALASGRRTHRPCRGWFGDDVDSSLRFAPSGRHYIVFVETASELLIIDFLHQASDFAARLEKLP